MVRIIEISPTSHDATSYYRGRGVFSRLQKEYEDIEMLQIRLDGMFDVEIKWPDIAVADILFLSRPASAEMVELVKLANKMNIPVWVDYDDLLLDVPKWNRTKTFYDQAEVKSWIEQILTMSQVVTVTTPMLKRRMSIYNDNIVIIPNAIDDYTFPEPVEFSDNNRVIWRGGDTHSYDLYVHRASINKIMAEFNEHEFVFIGYDAPFLDSPANKSVIPPMDIYSYFKTLRSLNASYNIIPLEKNDFNIAKSNISWLETHWSGGLSIAPNFGVIEDVYNDDSQYMYDEASTSLGSSFSSLMAVDGEVKRKNWEGGISSIEREYTLSKTNKLRHRVIKELIAQFS